MGTERNEKTVKSCEWEDGFLKIVLVCPELALVNRLVVVPPRAFRKLIRSKKFAAIGDLDKEKYANVGVTDAGMIYGFGAFLTAKGLDEGDLLVAKFDLFDNKVFLSKGDCRELP